MITIAGLLSPGQAINTYYRVDYDLRSSVKEEWVLVLGFFMSITAVSPGFSLVLNSEGRLGGLGGKVASVCEEFERITKVVCLVNASDSSGAGSPGLYRIKGVKQNCCIQI